MNRHCLPTSQGRSEDCQVVSLEMSAELTCLPSEDCLSHELDEMQLTCPVVCNPATYLGSFRELLKRQCTGPL